MEQSIGAVSLLAEPARLSLYEYVSAARAEVGRDEAAEATGVSRSLAAFHLDKLVDAGLLAVSYRRLTGKSGPGAGRPAKLYRRADAEHAVSVPPRGYGDAAQLLAEVVDQAGLEPQLTEAARRAGRELAGATLPHARREPDDPATDALGELLTTRGYQPYRDGSELRLRNCPFHALAQEFPPLICGMNLALLEGLLAGSTLDRDWSARIDPRPGECCVTLISKTKPS
jgi:predicted ArsR family transcriptional regulator